MDAIFDLYASILGFHSGRTGLTNKEINVWIFVILWRIVSLPLLVVILIHHRWIKILSPLRKVPRNNRST